MGVGRIADARLHAYAAANDHMIHRFSVEGGGEKTEEEVERSSAEVRESTEHSSDPAYDSTAAAEGIYHSVHMRMRECGHVIPLQILQMSWWSCHHNQNTLPQLFLISLKVRLS